MRKFEVGKRYGERAVVFEIIKRTARTITFVAIQHPGRYNEKRSEAKTSRIRDWGNREVFLTGDETVEA